MKYNSTKDIPYLKFMEFSNEISGHSEDHVFIADKVIEHFYPEVTDNHALYVEEFSIALNKQPKGFVPYLVCLGKLKTTEHFIDSVNYSEAKDFSNMFKVILKPWYWFGKVNPEKINLRDGQRIMQSFTTGSMKLKSLSNIFIIRQLRLQLK